MIDAPPPSAGPAGLYLHFPFCGIRCSYCDFATVAGQDHLVERYLSALSHEIRTFQHDLPQDVDTIFFGGGTPSRLEPEQLRGLLTLLGERFRLAAGTEITVECNPEGLDASRLEGFAAAGVNRLSIGVQSLDDAVLKRVGRAHDAAGAGRAVAQARSIDGLEINVDLIAGLPGESLSTWPETLRTVTRWGPDHVSVYLIETDKETPLARSVRSGRTQLANDDAMAETYEKTVATLDAEGFRLYEISNFAANGSVSRHNLKYWSDVEYGGFGLGAHAYAGGARRANRRDLPGYLEDLEDGRDPRVDTDRWDAGRRLDEAVILGLRKADGIDAVGLGLRYRTDLEARYGAVWDRAVLAGHLVREGGNVRLTPRGRLLSNSLFCDLLQP